MDKSFFRRAVWEVLRASLSAAAFCLLATALFALFVRALAPSQGVVTAVNQTIKCAGAFVFALIFVRGGRAFFKGLAAGALTALLTMLLFAAIGGGFLLTLLFLGELLLSAAAGGCGALLGAKLRKE